MEVFSTALLLFLVLDPIGNIPAFMAREPAKWPQWPAALLLAWTVSGAILLLAGQLARLLGRKTLIAIQRLMGLILTAVAVEMLIDGIGQAYHGIAQAS